MEKCTLHTFYINFLILFQFHKQKMTTQAESLLQWVFANLFFKKIINHKFLLKKFTYQLTNIQNEIEISRTRSKIWKNPLEKKSSHPKYPESAIFLDNSS